MGKAGRAQWVCMYTIRVTPMILEKVGVLDGKVEKQWAFSKSDKVIIASIR